MKGIKYSEESKRKISINHRNYQTKEAKEKISLALKGRKPWNVGISPSKETIKKMLNTKKGYKHSNNTKIKMSLSCKGSKNHNFGIHLSREWRDKISNTLKGRVSPMKGRILSEEHKIKLREARKNIKLPIKDTSIEIKIQNFLKQLNIEFFTHQYIKEITHSYQCDILIPSTKTIIECDGDYWHGNPLKFPILSEKQRLQKEKDKIRTEELQEKGFRVIRLWENDINNLYINKFEKIIT